MRTNTTASRSRRSARSAGSPRSRYSALVASPAPTPSTTPPAAAVRPLTIATMLTPLERVRVDVAARDSFQVMHRSSVDEMTGDVRAQQVDAVLVSVARYDPTSAARMAAMVREFPRVPTFALLTDVQSSTPHAVLELGRVGVRTLIDARFASGWTSLRELLLHERSTDVQRQTLGALDIDLAGAAPDCWRFFTVLFTHRPYVASVRQMGRHLNVVPGTLMSRFYRAQLPSPKRYIDIGRLVRAARLLENSGLSVTSVSRQLDYSSPQAFSRHVRSLLGISPVRFRELYNGESMLQRFREELILPHVSTLRHFRPAAAQPGWMTGAAGSHSTGDMAE